MANSSLCQPALFDTQSITVHLGYLGVYACFFETKLWVAHTTGLPREISCSTELLLILQAPEMIIPLFCKRWQHVSGLKCSLVDDRVACGAGHSVLQEEEEEQAQEGGGNSQESGTQGQDQQAGQFRSRATLARPPGVPLSRFTCCCGICCDLVARQACPFYLDSSLSTEPLHAHCYKTQPPVANAPQMQINVKGHLCLQCGHGAAFVRLDPDA